MIESVSYENRLHILRLEPNEDLKLSIYHWVNSKKISSAFCLSCIGSLHKAHIRLSGSSEEVQVANSPFEVLSLQGSMSLQGLHLHISISNKFGSLIGGHLLEKCIIKTTAEILIIEFSDIEFSRIFDSRTGYQELFFKPRLK